MISYPSNIYQDSRSFSFVSKDNFSFNPLCSSHHYRIDPSHGPRDLDLSPGSRAVWVLSNQTTSVSRNSHSWEGYSRGGSIAKDLPYFRYISCPPSTRESFPKTLLRDSCPGGYPTQTDTQGWVYSAV